MTNVARFLSLLTANGSDAVYHRENLGSPCPCLSPEGYRSPQWHIDHPTEPVCNEQGMLISQIVNVAVKAFVQPAQSAAVRRLTTEYLSAMFGEIQSDDHIGIFPLVWASTTLNFEDWSQAGEDYVLYDNHRYLVVNANKIPDPNGGLPHHWEIGLRLMTSERPTDAP